MLLASSTFSQEQLLSTFMSIGQPWIAVFLAFCISALILCLILAVVYRDYLHPYAHEDISVGSWMIGLDVQHVDERRLCCGSAPKGLSPPATPLSFCVSLCCVRAHTYTLVHTQHTWCAACAIFKSSSPHSSSNLRSHVAFLTGGVCSTIWSEYTSYIQRWLTTRVKALRIEEYVDYDWGTWSFHLRGLVVHRVFLSGCSMYIICGLKHRVHACFHVCYLNISL